MWNSGFRVILLAGLQLVFWQNTCGQNIKNLSQAQYQEEFSILVNALQEVHPALYQFKSKPALDSIITVFVKGIGPETTEASFHIYIRKFLRQIACGHLLAMPSLSWYEDLREDLRLIPFDVYLINNDLFVSQVFIDQNALAPGMQILEINGLETETIMADMRSIQTVDGFNTTLETSRINRLFPTYHLFLYGKQDTFYVRCLNLLGEEVNLKLAASQGRKARVQLKVDTGSYSILGQWPQVTFAVNRQMKDLALLQIKAFDTKNYKAWQKEVFSQLQEREIKHLILDLRDNAGGYFPNGNRLLRYFLDDEFSMDFYKLKSKPQRIPYLKLGTASALTKLAFNTMPDSDKADTNRNYSLSYKPQKKHPYRGEIYVLTNGGTFSLASLVTAKLKHHAKAQVVGEESGGGETGSNAILFYWLTLPYSQIRVRIPYYHLNHQVPAAQFGRGIIPHEAHKPTLRELLKGEDTTLQRVENLIGENLK
jgi:hypothetical protein